MENSKWHYAKIQPCAVKLKIIENCSLMVIFHSNRMSVYNQDLETDRAKKLAWYHPKTTKTDTETILKDQPYGSYLLRDSGEDKAFSLSIR